MFVARKENIEMKVGIEKWVMLCDRGEIVKFQRCKEATLRRKRANPSYRGERASIYNWEV